MPPVAAVCIYPSLVKDAARSARRLADQDRVGRDGVSLRPDAAEDAARGSATAVADGADEIDMVINRGAFLAGEFERVQDEIAAVVEACGDAALKVILEDQRARDLRQHSRGVVPRDAGDPRRRFHQDEHRQGVGSATLANNQVMIEAIRDFYLDTGIAIGMKPAGGIRPPSRRCTFSSP